MQCSVCGTIPAVKVRERRPGSKGLLSQSFSRTFQLCEACLALCREAGAVQDVAAKQAGRIDWVIVYARTYKWLITRKRG